MNAKRYFLAAAMFIGLSISALAQQPTTFPSAVRNAGLTVAPWPFKQTDSITITLNTTQTYPKNNTGLNGATAVFIHGGVNLGTLGVPGDQWKKVDQTGEWLNKPAKCQFVARTGVANTFDLRMRPSNFWALGAGENISEICAVFNDGQSTNTKSGGAAPLPGSTEPRSDFFIPLGATSTSVRNSDEYVEMVSASPNPSSSVVQIGFGMRKPGATTVKIFNSLGSEVKTLVQDKMHPQGYHIAMWEGDDNNGQALNAGVYLYRVEVNGTIKTGKIVLNR